VTVPGPAPIGVDWPAILDSAPAVDLPIAAGGALDERALLTAYRHGAYPFPCAVAADVAVNQVLYGEDVVRGTIPILSGREPLGPLSLLWWHPVRRPVFHQGGVRLPSSLRQELRNRHAWATTCDTAYEAVLAECRRERRQVWLTNELCESLLRLHDDRWAHSIEIWDGPKLIGGLIGIGIGTVFSMDSAFGRSPNAAKVAFADLDRRLAGTAARLLDVQVRSAYTTALGAVMLDRRDYLREVESAGDRLVPRHGTEDARSLAPRRAAGPATGQ
jgi:leucyl/phenylalanyl-tRNA--protein transferase